MTAKTIAVARGFVIESWDNADVFMVMLVSSVPYSNLYTWYITNV